MADYIAPNELRSYIGSDTANNEDLIGLACTVASRLAEKMCSKPEGGFFPDDTATARRFFADDWACVQVDDFWTSSGLVVQSDDNADGTFETTWTVGTDFVLEPDVTDRPFSELRAVGSKLFLPRCYAYGRRTVQVTAQWGWEAVPDAVRNATLMLAAQLYKLKDAPDGFVGLDGWGPTQVRENKFVRAVLGPYMKSPIAVA